MNVLSLFDGISGARLALERAGIKVNKYYTSEIDNYALKIARKNYSDNIELGDINNIDPDALPNIDLIVAGSPCQGFSIAGKQLNFNDHRSKLFFKFVEILEAVKPKYFLLENVKMKREYADFISKILGVKQISINSNLVSAQNRNRFYWTNIAGIEQPKNKNIYLKDIIKYGFVDREKSYCIDANYFKGGNLKQYFEKKRRQLVFSNEFLLTWRKLTPIECERLQTYPDNFTQGVSNSQRYKMLGNSFTVDVIAHIFSYLDSHS